jgi:hypothetical protein
MKYAAILLGPGRDSDVKDLIEADTIAELEPQVAAQVEAHPGRYGRSATTWLLWVKRDEEGSRLLPAGPADVAASWRAEAAALREQDSADDLARARASQLDKCAGVLARLLPK